jgi:hypothetical protein
MKKSGQQDKNPFVFYFSDSGLSEGSLIKARIFSIDSKEVRSEPFVVENKVISFENERKALNLLLSIVKRIEVSVAECPDRYRPFGVLCEIRKRIVENTVKQIYTLWLSYLEK